MCRPWSKRVLSWKIWKKHTRKIVATFTSEHFKIFLVNWKKFIIVKFQQKIMSKRDKNLQSHNAKKIELTNKWSMQQQTCPQHVANIIHKMNFRVIVWYHCRLDAGVYDSIKLMVAEYIKIFPVNFEGQTCITK